MSRNEAILALRAQMKTHGIDAYILPTADPHQSEYLPEYYAGRVWISGFKGSAGTVVVTQDHAGLWTDGRYFIQAESELVGSEFVMHKLVVQTQAEYLDWCIANLSPGQTVGCDFWCISFGQLANFDAKLKEAGLILKDCGDLLKDVWTSRPSLPKSPVYLFEDHFAGESRDSKLKRIRLEMKNKKANHLLISALDEVAWALNLRGSDVHCNPVFVAYLLIDEEKAQLFIDPSKLQTDTVELLKSAGVHVQAYDSILGKIQKIRDGLIWIDPSNINCKIALQIPAGSIYSAPSPVMLAKALKNEVEISHIRRAMEKDCHALIQAFIWLEETLQSGQTPTEYEFAMKIKACRASQKDYVGESFDAIIGYRSNGAIIHYKPDPTHSKKINPEGILLVDSGGQYLDGTTDITRTIALSPVSDEIKKINTAVLKGNISLSRAVFPAATKGIQLDLLARQYLWQQLLNYGHGTGHGVGFFMNVHEPPQGFVAVWNQRGSAELQPGMLTSNEPGFYQEGEFGIRIENLVLTIPAGQSEYGEFLKFETMTLFPIDTHLIYFPDLDRSSIDWLNAYHEKVFNRVSPYLNEKEKNWLQEKCKQV
ncbi:MAG: aminopeptidase P family protein [Saprospiraceae bacterium]|nr:aminopeptidase P family protein [Saprospiraceae bacterium]MBK7810514.1 aminopeptidase P family protein [Saprospiraceae bacterium]MBK9630105.1 aminopeptidase P family protein [Saprospiraceae bacterium]